MILTLTKTNENKHSKLETIDTQYGTVPILPPNLIKDFTGLEKLVNLTQFECSGCADTTVTNIDFSANTSLVSIKLYSTHLTSVDVSAQNVAYYS